MCIAILKTKEGKITDEALTASFNSNKDGAGIAYSKDGILHIKKGIFSAKELIKEVREAEKICDGNMLIHCRIGTSGNMDAANTHPFIVRSSNNRAVGLIHNGILDIDVPKDSKINDTQIFINEYLKDIPEDMLMFNPAIKKMIAELIGSSNKFVLLDNNNNYVIINEKAGHWEDGVWYSNYSYIPFTYTGKSYAHGSIFGYGYDDYEDLDDYRLRGYGDDAMKITEKVYNRIYKELNKLSYQEIANLGYFPCYNFSTKRIVPKSDSRDVVELDRLSCDLYDYYMDLAEEAEDTTYVCDDDDDFEEGEVIEFSEQI